MKGSRGLEKDHYKRKLLEKKLDKADPKLSFQERMAQAMAAMEELLGEQDDCQKLAHEGDKEGLGELPEGIEDEEEVAEVQKHKSRLPTIFVIIRDKLSVGRSK
jgi:hypothetical protein